MLATALAAGLPFILAPIRARLLGPAGRGEFAYFQSSVTIIFSVAALGVRHAIYRERRVGTARFESSNFAFLGLAFGASTLVGVVLAFLAVGRIPVWIVQTVVAVGLLGPVYAITQIEVASAQLSRQRRRIAAISSGPAVIEFLVNIFFLIIRQFGIVSVVITTLFAELFRNTAAMFWRFRDRERGGSVSVTNDRWGTKLLRASIVAAPAVSVPVLSSNLDSIIYGSALGPRSLGMYTVAKLGYTVFLLLAVTAEGYVVAKLAHRVPWQIVARLLAFFLPVAAAAAVVGVYVFPAVFGSAYDQAKAAFPVAVAAGAVGGTFVSLLAVAAYNSRHRSALAAASGSLVALCAGAASLSLVEGVNASDMCLILLGAQVVGVALIVFRMSPREIK